MKAWKLTKSIVLQRQVTTQDGVGQVTNSWEDIAPAWASIEPIRGQRYFTASGEKANITHEIGMRAKKDVTLGPRDRVKYGDRYFSIRSVINVEERGKEWLLMCIEELQTQ